VSAIEYSVNPWHLAPPVACHTYVEPTARGPAGTRPVLAEKKRRPAASRIAYDLGRLAGTGSEVAAGPKSTTGGLVVGDSGGRALGLVGQRNLAMLTTFGCLPVHPAAGREGSARCTRPS
jgi:hypothetical protein